MVQQLRSKHSLKPSPSEKDATETTSNILLARARISEQQELCKGKALLILHHHTAFVSPSYYTARRSYKSS